MVLVSLFAGAPQHGQVVFTHSSMAASGDSPVPVGSIGLYIRQTQAEADPPEQARFRTSGSG